MNKYIIRSILIVAFLTVALLFAHSNTYAHDPAYTRAFMRDKCTFSSIGGNPFFILNPGYQLDLQGREDGKTLRVVITVLNETKAVDGVETRVVEERESEDGELIEVSRNYYAICSPTNSVFYFGEDVDIYDKGEIVSHDGAWLSGVNGAVAGIIMPGQPLLGSRHFQEIAPGVAMDRAEIVSLNKTLMTPFGKFTEVMKVVETTPLEPGHTSIKFYAPEIGLIKDGKVKLVDVFGGPS